MNPPTNALRPSLKVSSRPARFVGSFAISMFGLGSLLADQHTSGVPEYSSKPGADYTIYINVAGFNFSGAWSGSELGAPNSESNPQVIGSDKYTQDWFKFAVPGTSTVTLTLNNATDFLLPGTADGLGTFRGLLDIYSADGITLLFSATESLDTTKATFTGTLAGGDYLARVQSYGGHAGDALGADPSSYYDMGGYFLTGSGFSQIPEASTFLMGIMALGFVVRRRRLS